MKAMAARSAPWSYRGKAGWLTLKLLVAEALGNQEQHLLVAATTTDGVSLDEEDPEKLLRLPATTQAASLFNNAGDATLVANVATRKTELLRDINQRNLGYFEQEVQKLDAWADDLKPRPLSKKSRRSTARSRKFAARQPPRPRWKKNCHGRRSSANWKASAASCGGNCSIGRMRSKRSATT